MTDLLFARWTCAECSRRGVVSGERSDTTAQEPEDPAHFNCYYCQQTVSVPLPPGLDRWHLRVEGEHVLEPAPACPACAAPAEAFWDERDTPLLTCGRCAYCARLPEPPVDPEAWEVLLESRDEKIERRRASGGWAYRSEAYYKKGGRLRAVRQVTTLEGFEPDPGRPLSQIFKEIRAEHRRLRAEALAPPAPPPGPEEPPAAKE